MRNAQSREEGKERCRLLKYGTWDVRRVIGVKLDDPTGKTSPFIYQSRFTFYFGNCAWLLIKMHFT